jgi:hypothetical protein
VGGQGSGKKSIQQLAEQVLKTEASIDRREIDWTDETEKAITGLMEIDSNAIVYLYRLWPAQPDQPFKGPKYASKFYGPVDIEDIRAKHGGGAYRAQIETKENGNRKYSAYTFYIEGPPIYETPQVTGAPAADDPTLKRMERLETAINAVMAKLGNANQDQSARLQDLKMLAEIIRPPGDNIEGMMNIFKMGVELGGKATGGDDWASVLKEVVPSVLDTLKSRQQRPIILRPKNKPAEIAPVDRGAEPAKAPPQPREENLNLELIQILADTLRDAIDYGDSAETAARYIGRLITDDDFAQLAALQPAHVDLFVEKFFTDRPDSKEFINKVLTVLTKEEEK